MEYKQPFPIWHAWIVIFDYFSVLKIFIFRPCPHVSGFFFPVFEKIRVHTPLHALQGMRSVVYDIIVFELFPYENDKLAF